MPRANAHQARRSASNSQNQNSKRSAHKYTLHDRAVRLQLCSRFEVSHTAHIIPSSAASARRRSPRRRSPRPRCPRRAASTARRSGQDWPTHPPLWPHRRPRPQRGQEARRSQQRPRQVASTRRPPPRPKGRRARKWPHHVARARPRAVASGHPARPCRATRRPPPMASTRSRSHGMRARRRPSS
eukprot:scaffold174480_cov31-Tisochrysis_lutea.AAC.1